MGPIVVHWGGPEGDLPEVSAVTHPQGETLLQELTRANPRWNIPAWEAADPQLSAAERAPYRRSSGIFDDIAPPNLYTVRGPRRVGKSTLLKQTVARLCREGVDPRRVCYFAADALASFRDIVNLFQSARLLFPGLGDPPRYFLPPPGSCRQLCSRGCSIRRDKPDR